MFCHIKCTWQLLFGVSPVAHMPWDKGSIFWTPQCHADIGAHGGASTIGALMMQVSHHILSQSVHSTVNPECNFLVWVNRLTQLSGYRGQYQANTPTTPTTPTQPCRFFMQCWLWVVKTSVVKNLRNTCKTKTGQQSLHIYIICWRQKAVSFLFSKDWLRMAFQVPCETIWLQPMVV